MKPVSGAPDFLALEEKIQKFWDDTQAFAKLQQRNEGRPLFRFVDGPITANNPMGVHHAWGRTLKDVVIRYKVMNGHSAKYQNGFDCQGLWVEVEVEKDLGLGGKPDIEALGLDVFSRKCRERVEKFSKIQSEQSERLGQWMDWDNSYYTHDDSNIRGIWHFLKLCQENGWLYEKGLPMPWCARCGTSLSEHEMAGSYKDIEHLTVYIQLPLKDGSNRRLLLWTTTPWTLSANVAAAVNPRLHYVEVTSPKFDHTLILCEDALPKIREFKPEVQRTFTGEELIGLEFETCFPDFAEQAEVPHRVIPWDAVDASEGSGIVHIAPGCGKEDFELSIEHDLAKICPIDDNAIFLDGFGWLTGEHAQKSADAIAEALEKSGKLLKSEPYSHSYPHCWRCKDELVFRLVDEWFISCDEVRPRMIEAARKVEWSPAYLGKRMEDWLNNMGDWCISRKRFWGLPLPFYRSESGATHVIGSIEELKEMAVDPSKVDDIPELHRPWIDGIDIKLPNGEIAKRVPEVGDCWLDAGIVPYSTLGYFDDREAWEKACPAEWISEMREQVRLWFYSMLFMGVTISDRAPYEKVLGYERVVAEDGSMFSKTGFMIHFDDAVERLGADPMRYVYCTQPVTSDLRFGFTLGELAQRKLCDLWNIYSFFVMYALIDKPDVSKPAKNESLHITDRWLLARTEKMRETVTTAHEAVDMPALVREVEEYLDDLSNWYIRINRRRFWRSGHEDDKLAAYTTLLHALETTTLVMAPVVPFLSEEIWQNAVRSLRPDAAESVHHADWPKPREEWKDDTLLAHGETVRKAVNMARSLREQAQIRVRQPLSTLYVIGNERTTAAVADHLAVIQTELNVKSIECLESAESLQADQLAMNFKGAGPILRGDVNKVKGLLEALSGDDMTACVAAFDAGDEVPIPGYDTPVNKGAFTKELVAQPHIRLAEDGPLTVALDTTITDALKAEGTARDIVHHIQNMRKNADLEVTQRIELALATDDAFLRSTIDTHKDYIMEEVLAVSLKEEADNGVAHSDSIKVAGAAIAAGISPA
jgi:isoleucyl-tRNA synthetase